MIFILPFIHIFGLSVPSYGLMITLGFILGLIVAVLRAGIHKFKKEDVIYAGLYAGLGVFLGAKLLYALVNIPEMIRHAYLIKEDFILWLELGFGGLVFYGGLFGGIFGLWVYAKQFKLSFSDMLETYIPAVPLMHAIGRVGCFLGGCCYGIPWPEPIGMVFTESLSAPNGVSLFPVQLLESALCFALFLALMLYARRPRAKYRVAGLYLAAYALIRLVTEQFRYDEARGIFLGLSTSRWISIALLPAGLILMFLPRLKKRFRRTDNVGDSGASGE